MNKHLLFDRFSKNLDHIKRFYGITFHEEDTSELYICPLSFRVHTKEGLDEKFEDQLTAEHAPPKSLNGKVVALTTKNLNTKSGHTYDTKLEKFINLIDFKNGVSDIATTYRIDNSFSIKGEVSKRDQLQFNFQTKTFHQGAQKFLNLLKSGEQFRIEFSLPNSKRPDLAFLRIAYLIAFGELGYSALFGRISYINSSMAIIRQQLLNPETSIISNIPILKDNFPDEFLGVNIIYHPKEIKALFVVFDLETDNNRHRYGVFLPGPDSFGFKFQEYLTKAKSIDNEIKFEAYTFPQKLDLTKFEDSIHYYEAWEKLNGWEK
ncbi:MAG: hypothetical protein KA479_04895 [Saprospiraceae bacterium]|nr:hypothetical protein [Saprospiraceae bacterium]